MPNRLATETSPYLLQHAENPVDWWPWGPEAFAEARRLDRPVLISVGYAACHWCHVMAHESFEDVAVAGYLNDHFVAIKVDREERPDVDAVYMTATQSLTGSGGWPMTVFTTADGEPFYAGTYFPPEPRHGSPSFSQLLQALNQAWQGDRTDVLEAASRISQALKKQSQVPSSGEALEQAQVAEICVAAVGRLATTYDVTKGGFGGAPKFPPSMVLEFLLREHARTGDPRAMSMAAGTAEAMARGGMYDQLAGGFARYSVDADWVIPHFEKMLYDNALLLRTYLHWWRTTGDELAARVVRQTAEFLLTELRTPEGGFASALDADSEGEEGRAYVWTPAQLVDVLGREDGDWAADLLNVTADGTFEHGSSVLQLHQEPDSATRWELIRRKLLESRTTRVQPGRDDKVVTAWNGMAIAALAEAGAMFEQPQWVEAAVECGELLWSLHREGADRLHRVSRGGVCGVHNGVLEDYACVADAYLSLHSVTGSADWLARAGALLDVVLTQFRDHSTGGFFDTPSDGESLLVRPQDHTDNATPSGWSSAAGALLSYAALTGSEVHRSAAEAALPAVVAIAGQHPRFAGYGLAVLEAWLEGPREVAIVGSPDDPARAAMARSALLGTAPGAVLSVGVPDQDGVPLLAGRPLVAGGAATYVCRHFTCEAPVTTAARVAELLGVRVS
jgi:uncharacterized protein YyaL (SSP411 family)